MLVGRRFLERVQVLSVNVLQQCVPQKLIVLGGANDGWNALQPRRPGRPDPPLAHHDLVAVATRTNHDRLQHTYRFDAGGQVLQRPLVERLAGLARIAVDAAEWELLERGTRRLLRSLRGRRLLADSLGRRLVIVLRAAWDQRFQSTAETTTASHQLAPSPVGASRPLRSANSKVRSR